MLELPFRILHLILSTQDLMDRDHMNQEKIDVEKAKLSKYTEDKNNEILGYNNQVF